MDWHSSSVNGVSAQSNLAGTGYSASGSAWATAGNAPSVYASAFATSITSTPVGTWSSASETYWYSVMDASPSAPYYAYVQVSYGGTQSRSSSNGNFALSTGDQLTIGGFGEWTNLNSLGQSTGGLVVIGQWYEVQMDVSVEALVTNSNGGSASVTDFIDPEISLSPGWAASHPDASIQFSDLQPSTTPEPTSILLLGTGLAGLGGLIRRKLRV
jgi:hypothetical protein